MVSPELKKIPCVSFRKELLIFYRYMCVHNILKNFSFLPSDPSIMFEDIWHHALHFLDNYKYDVHNYGPSELYKFADDTGILARHKNRMEKPFTEKDIDIKVVYSELVKMLLDYEEKRFPDGFNQVKDIHKIQGFQDLTNRLQYSLNQKFEANFASLNSQVLALQRHNEAQQKQIDFLLSKMGETQKDVLLTLEQRIDVNDQYINHLRSHEAEQDERLDRLEDGSRKLKRKTEDLESANELITETQKTTLKQVKALEVDQERQDTNMATLDDNIRKVRNEQERYELSTQEQITKLNEVNDHLNRRMDNTIDEVRILKEELVKLRAKQFVSPDEYRLRLDEIEIELRRIEALARSEERNISIVSSVQQEFKESLNVEISGIERHLKQDILDLKTLLRNDRLETDGRIDTIAIRMDALQDGKRPAISEEEIQRIWADLDLHRKDVQWNKNNLREMLEKVLNLEASIADNRKSIVISNEHLTNCEETIRKIGIKADESLNRVDTIGQATKDLWKDQRRQDDDLVQIKAEFSGSAKWPSSFELEITSVRDDFAIVKQQIGSLQNELNRLDRVDHTQQEKLDLLDERSLKNLERIVLLEERNQIELEQANYVETINSKIVQLEKEKAQTAVDWKYDTDRHEVALHTLREDLKKLLGRVDDHEGALSGTRGDIRDLENRFELNLQRSIDTFAQSFKVGDFQKLRDLVESKFLELDGESQRNKGHVEKLRELNSKLMVEIPSQVNKELQLIRTEMSSVDNLRVSDIEALRRTFGSIEADFAKFRQDIDQVFVNVNKIERKQESFVAEIQNTNITINSTQVEQIQHGFMVITNKLEDRILALEDVSGDWRAAGKKTESLLLATLNENMQNLRFELDAVGNGLKAEIEHIRGATGTFEKDFAKLHIQLRAVDAIVHDTDYFKERLRRFEALQAELSLKYDKFDNLIDAVRQELRLDMTTLKRDIDVTFVGVRDQRDEVDGKVGGIYARLDELERDLKVAAKDRREISTNLESHRKEIEGAKEDFDGRLNLLTKFERDISSNRENVANAKADILAWEAKLRELIVGVEDAENKASRNEKSIRDIWNDQQRQDSDLGRVTLDSNYSKIISSLDVDLKHALENLEIMKRKVAALEKESERQARVDVDLKETLEVTDERSLKNLERIVLLEEMNQIQVEQANYVETINSKIVQLEEEKSQKAADWKYDSEQHELAIQTLRGDLKKLLEQIQGYDGIFAVLRGDISDLGRLKTEVKNIWEDQERQNNDLGHLKREVKSIWEDQERQNNEVQDYLRKTRVDITEIQSIRQTLDGIGALHLRIDTLGEGQSRFDKLLAELRNSIAGLDQTSEINELRVSLRNVLGMEGSIGHLEATVKDLLSLKADLRRLEERDFVSPQLLHSRLLEIETELTRIESLAKSGDQSIIIANVHQELKAILNAEIDGLGRQLRRELGELTVTVRNSRADLDGRLDMLAALIRTVQENNRNTTTDETIQKIFANLEKHGVEISRSRSDLNGILEKIQFLDNGLVSCKELVIDCEQKVRRADVRIDETADKVENIAKATKELWKDQQRQDDDMTQMRVEIGRSRVTVDVSGINDQIALNKRQIDVIQNELTRLDRVDHTQGEKLSLLDEISGKNRERIILLEERNQIQVEQANYLETINSKVIQLEQEKAQTSVELKFDGEKYELALHTMQGDMKRLLERIDRYDNLLSVIRGDVNAFDYLKKEVTKLWADQKRQDDNIETFANRTKQLELFEGRFSSLDLFDNRLKGTQQDIKDLESRFELRLQEHIDIFSKNFKGGDFKTLMDLVENRLYELGRESQKNKGHVDKLRELNKKLMLEIPSQVNKELQLIRDEMSNMDRVRISEIDVLKRMFNTMEGEVGSFKTNLEQVFLNVGKLEKKQKNIYTDIQNTQVTVSSTQVQQIQQEIVLHTNRLQERILALEDKSDDWRSNSKKSEALLVGVIDDRMHNIRHDLDSIGNKLKIEVDEIRDTTDKYEKDFAHLKVDIKEMFDNEERQISALRNFDFGRDAILEKIELILKDQGHVSARFNHVDGLIDEIRGDFRKKLKEVRADLEVTAHDVKANRDEVDGRIGNIYARLDILQDELKGTSKDKNIQKLLAELEFHSKEISLTKGNLGGLSDKLHTVELLIAKNKESIHGNGTLIGHLKSDVDNSNSRISYLDAELRNLKEHAEWAKLKSLEQEVARQAKTDKHLLERIEEVHGRSTSNLERIILLEERNEIQVEQANYVETMSSKIVQLEKEKVQNVADWRVDAAKHEDSIVALREELNKLVVRVDGQDIDIGKIKVTITRLDGLNGRVNVLETDVEGLRRSIEKNASDIQNVHFSIVQEREDRGHGDNVLNSRVEQSVALLGRKIAALGEHVCKMPYASLTPSR